MARPIIYKSDRKSMSIISETSSIFAQIRKRLKRSKKIENPPDEKTHLIKRKEKKRKEEKEKNGKKKHKLRNLGIQRN